MSTFIGSRQAAREDLAIATGYGILDRDFRKELGMKVPKFSALSILRELEGKMRPTKQVRRHEYYFYEEGEWFNAAATIATADNAVANKTTITLSSEDHWDSGSKSYPVVGQLALFENEQVGYVESINRTTPNAHTVTIKDLNPSTDVQASAVIGTSVVFYGNIQAEKSLKTEGRVPAVSRVSNYIHTTREKYEVTDFAAQNEVEFEYNGQKFLYVKGIDETADRFAMQEEWNLIVTPRSESLTDADGNPLSTANGLIPQVDENGMTYEYEEDVDMSAFDDIVLQINDNYGDDEYMGGLGINLSLSMKNWLIDFTRNGDTGVSYNYFSGGKEQALSFDFTSIRIGGIAFHFKTWDVMSHRGSFGAGNMPYRDMGVLIPCGNTKDPQTNKMTPYLTLAYSKPQGAAHEVQGDIKVWETGGNAKKGATNDEMTREIHMISYKSLEVRNREKFMILRKSQS
jgi:hypothetical protein